MEVPAFVFVRHVKALIVDAGSVASAVACGYRRCRRVRPCVSSQLLKKIVRRVF